MISIFNKKEDQKDSKRMVWVIKPSIISDINLTKDNIKFFRFDIFGLYEYVGVDPSPLEYKFILKNNAGSLVSFPADWCFEDKEYADKFIKIHNSRVDENIFRLIRQQEITNAGFESRIKFLENRVSEYEINKKKK